MIGITFKRWPEQIRSDLGPLAHGISSGCVGSLRSIFLSIIFEWSLQTNALNSFELREIAPSNMILELRGRKFNFYCKNGKPKQFDMATAIAPEKLQNSEWTCLCWRFPRRDTAPPTSWAISAQWAGTLIALMHAQRMWSWHYQMNCTRRGIKKV